MPLKGLEKTQPIYSDLSFNDEDDESPRDYIKVYEVECFMDAAAAGTVGTARTNLKVTGGSHRRNIVAKSGGAKGSVGPGARHKLTIGKSSSNTVGFGDGKVAWSWYDEARKIVDFV